MQIEFVALGTSWAKPPSDWVVHYRPWMQIVDPLVRRKSTWTVELSASIFRQHMPASLPHSEEHSLRGRTNRAIGTFRIFCSGST